MHFIVEINYICFFSCYFEIMVELLYSDFLENKRVYNLARASWKRFFDQLAEQQHFTYQPYLNEKQNGQLEYDGNPIFNAFLPTLHRAIRIVQVANNGSENIDFSSWIDTIQWDENLPPVEELVIDMVLSKESKALAALLIEKWCLKQHSKAEMVQFIEKITDPSFSAT